jgi:hypothetical protein
MFENYTERINKNRHLSTKQNAYFCVILYFDKAVELPTKIKKNSRKILKIHCSEK